MRYWPQDATHVEASMETTVINVNSKDSTIITGTYNHVVAQAITNQIIANEQLAGGKYENMVFENVTFENCTIQASVFLETNFIDCKFKNCNFSFSKFLSCNLVACTFENCHFCITNSLTCNFLTCTFLDNTWKLGVTRENKLIDCYLGDETYFHMEVNGDNNDLLSTHEDNSSIDQAA
jgi:uncharacterized protein YjbI with pentapeptide repeats